MKINNMITCLGNKMKNYKVTKIWNVIADTPEDAIIRSKIEGYIQILIEEM